MRGQFTGGERRVDWPGLNPEAARGVNARLSAHLRRAAGGRGPSAWAHRLGCDLLDVVHQVSGVGVVRPPGVGVYRPHGVAPKGISNGVLLGALFEAFCHALDRCIAERAQNGVDASLVARTLRLEPFEDVLVDSKRDR